MNEGPSIIPGTWHSIYEYESTGRGGVLTDEREVTLAVGGPWAWVSSLPGSSSLLGIELRVEGRALTGTWMEETDPAGYYKGITFRGAVQFILAADCRSMAGRWVGHSRDMTEVNTGTWTLTLAGSAWITAARRCRL